MAVIRTRFLIWLFKAYVKKWGKLFLLFFFFGLVIFFLLLRFSPVIIRYIPIDKKTVVGQTGAYTVDGIPDYVLQRVAKGLTKVDSHGKVTPDLASTWEIKNGGKTYIFYLRKDKKFTDGTPFTAKSIRYSFKDVTINRPDDYTVIFNLKDEYAPFLVTVSQPIFHKGYIGIGDLTINNIKLNGNFIQSLQLLSVKNKFMTEEYVFYPSNESLKIALALGEITEAKGLTDLTIENRNLADFPNLTLRKKLNNAKLVTLFYNNQDPVLSDKKWRNGLTYSLPDEFSEGLRVYNPYPPESRFSSDEQADRNQDINHARLLIDSALETASTGAKPVISLKTLSKYKNTAEIIKNSWSKLGIETKVEQVDTIPQTFQIYLGDFNISKDPDQYSLWHSGQQNNITRVKNLRIDKLLEDGRRNTDPQTRLKIYQDFQKYLLDESPAAFLYFPYEYDISRK